MGLRGLPDIDREKYRRIRDATFVNFIRGDDNASSAGTPVGDEEEPGFIFLRFGAYGVGYRDAHEPRETALVDAREERMIKFERFDPRAHGIPKPSGPIYRGKPEGMSVEDYRGLADLAWTAADAMFGLVKPFWRRDTHLDADGAQHLSLYVEHVRHLLNPAFIPHHAVVGRDWFAWVNQRASALGLKTRVP